MNTKTTKLDHQKILAWLRTDDEVPITNYGVTIAYTLGIFQRALEPFPATLEACRERSLGHVPS